ncbi:MAG: hypothetical protein ACREFD_03535 [Stellaceae bacterium]
MAAGKRATKQRRPRKSNPAAKALGTPAYRPRIVKSKKAYTRKSDRSEPTDA